MNALAAAIDCFVRNAAIAGRGVRTYDRTMSMARALNQTERQELEESLSFAASIAMAEPPLTPEQMQALYDEFLKEPVSDANAIKALGYSFGEYMVSSGPFEWVRVLDDQYGDETGIAVLGTAIYLHPISMIQNRLADRLPVAIDELCNHSLESVAAIINRGAARTR